MIIILEPATSVTQRKELLEDLKRRGFGVHISEGVERTIVGKDGMELDVPYRDATEAATAG